MRVVVGLLVAVVVVFGAFSALGLGPPPPPLPPISPDACEEGLTRSTGEVGLCSGNVEVCVDGVWVDSPDNYAPQPEVCDGEDNDCDGLVDQADPSYVALP
ncbi:hypothetical protein JXA12_03590, partial [Candidatus Woesearchaeota archaeon]|nr:hypothetical protein [Candidatus Woesearchaeota archaeon]